MDPALEDAAILRDRARQLANVGVGSEDASPSRLLLCFELGTGKFGIEAEQVHEVFPLDHSTRVPCTPPHIAGIAAMRGELVTLVDLKRFLDIPSAGLTNFNKVIVVRHDGKCVGLIADKVLGVESIKDSDLHNELPEMPDIRIEFLMGMTNEPLLILDVAKLLGSSRFLVHDEPRAG